MAFKSRIFTGILVVCSLVLLANCAFPVRPGYDRKSGTYKRYRVATTTPEPVDTTAVDPQEELVQEEKLAVASTTSTDSIAPAVKEKTNSSDSASHTSNLKSKPDSTVVRKDSIVKIDSTKKDSVKKQPAKKTEVASKAKKQTKRVSKPTNLEKYAKEWLGAKYVYGAASKKKTDCSGYVMQVYKGFYGISLDHSAQHIYDDGRGYSIKRTKLQEGDLVFFGNFWKISHVGIYLKGNRFIHASTSKGVVITSMDDNYWSSKYKGARRFK
ncbi:C40 family peptidase [Fibrobacter sp. UWB13]|uniref:C40 family peptidase n=1 Tax=Fibrobacter sp. UWB13 TaxID=1896204 RepID=UPI000A097A14|nr:C40 family peptidase [Fibrobacter sp. UWB13]SMG38751.1 Cell wall-associated hydrolase, NlpC family [Fibrobacter sp. UWB13]